MDIGGALLATPEVPKANVGVRPRALQAAPPQGSISRPPLLFRPVQPPALDRPSSAANSAALLRGLTMSERPNMPSHQRRCGGVRRSLARPQTVSGPATIPGGPANHACCSSLANLPADTFAALRSGLPV